jgi:mono/diheme cytochrome c family protein
MKTRYVSFRATRCIGHNHKTIGVCVFGIIILGVMVLRTSAAAQKRDNSPEKTKESTYAALAEAPEKARRRKNPFEGDAQAVAAGEKLFQQHCAECHGEKAGGTKKGPSLLREEVHAATPGTLFWILTNGVVRRGMPVWSKLPEQQRWQLVIFLQSLKPQSVDSQPGNNE